MKGLCKRAGIDPYLGFHTLRHLMAPLLADNPKISTKTIQNILGHSEARTTETYLHKLDGAIEDAMDSISGRFASKIEKPQPLVPTKRKRVSKKNSETLAITGRGERIRTSDILLPKQARYQAALRPDI